MTDRGRPTKVERLVDEYDLPADTGETLEAHWTGGAGERKSLRDLADYLNVLVLEQVVDETDLASMSGEIENLYRLLTDDEVSSGERTEARERLSRAGVDPAKLRSDFVSYQAVRTYLTSVRDASYEPATDRAERVKETTRRLAARTSAVTERNLEQLRDTDRLALGSFRLFVDVAVLCEDCGVQYQADELLERGGCACEE